MFLPARYLHHPAAAARLAIAASAPRRSLPTGMPVPAGQLRAILTGLGENRVSFVSYEDVAAAAAGILLGDGHEGAIHTTTSDERLTGAERAH
ncbi:hypothetical protein [Sphingomonas sp. MMS24-J13]|uniref:hypothetical protein n=1 Tax=Sphingomonas sp. MMS24-J13 TaxID=3238686 RepID=UPI00384AC566